MTQRMFLAVGTVRAGSRHCIMKLELEDVKHDLTYVSRSRDCPSGEQALRHEVRVLEHVKHLPDFKGIP